MAEQLLEGEQQIESGATQSLGNGDGDKGGKKTNEQILAENRQGLYNQILKFKDPDFSDPIKKIGYKKFESLLKSDKDFQSALITDLNERGVDISPDRFFSSYADQKQGYTFDFAKQAREEAQAAAAPAPVEKQEEGFLGQVKGLYNNYIKGTIIDLPQYYTAAKRGFLSGRAGKGAQIENFATNTVDVENLAEYLKQADEVGALPVEEAYAKKEGALKDSWDFINMLGPAIVESFSNMAGAGGEKMAAITAAGATIGGVKGAVAGSAVPLAGNAAGAYFGAVEGGTTALRYAMLQQGYNLEFTGTVIDELQTKKIIDIKADKKTLAKQLKDAFDNKELMAPIFKKANTRAAAVLGTDWFLSGMGSGTTRVLTKALTKNKVVQKGLTTPVGKFLTSFAEQTVRSEPYRYAAKLAVRAKAVRDKVAKTRVGKAADLYGVPDMAGGALGEFNAQTFTEGDYDFDAIALEGGTEGKFIQILRSLGKVGDKKMEMDAALDTEKSKSKDEDIEYVEVTQQEFDDYKKGKVAPERAAGIVADLDIALKDPAHLEFVAATDPLYGQMVKDAHSKFLRALEKVNLRKVALSDIAETNNKPYGEIEDAIDPNSPNYSETIAKQFNNTLNVLQQQFDEKNDKENGSRISSEIGNGETTQQTESQQTASDEEAGSSGVFQTSLNEQRIAEIDGLIEEDNKYFQETKEKLLSDDELNSLQEERNALLQENAQQTATPSTQNAGQENTGAVSNVAPQSASTEVGGGLPATTTSAGETTQQQTQGGTPVVGETVPGTEGGVTTETPAAPIAITENDVEVNQAGEKFFDVKYKGDSIGYTKYNSFKKWWEDSYGNTYSSKEDAIKGQIDRYNNKVGAVAAPETTTETVVAETAQPVKTNQEQIADLRAAEQAELDSKIKDANKYRGADGKVDRTKLTKKADIKAFDEVYAKYDKLISPLMETKVEPKKEEPKGKKYPIEDKGKWYADEDYEKRGGKLVTMTPDKFLAQSKPLEIDEEARNNIDTLKKQIQNGGKLDPLAIYSTDKTKSSSTDGRHRAIAAKELGIKEVPVLDFTTAETKAETKGDTKPTGKTETKTETKTESTTAPTFAAYDAIFDERSKKTEARNSFIEEHGKPVYDAMNEISTKFTKIIKDLEDKGVLTKKC